MVGSAGRLGPIGLPVFPALEAGDPDDDGQGHGNDIVAVALPQLESLVAAELLVDLTKQRIVTQASLLLAQPPRMAA
jgi:hypothetical protein